MPTYDYECTECDHTFERFQSIKARPLRKCPACGGRLRRLIGTGAGIIFKGSGFYETDYKRNRRPAGDKPGEKTSDKAGGGEAQSKSTKNKSTKNREG